MLHVREILTFAPTKQFQSVVVSSSKLAAGTTYDVYYGGSSSGAASDGLYPDGTYSGGAQYTSFTISSVVTWIGTSGGMGGGFPGDPGGAGNPGSAGG